MSLVIIFFVCLVALKIVQIIWENYKGPWKNAPPGEKGEIRKKIEIEINTCFKIILLGLQFITKTWPILERKTMPIVK